MRFESQHDHDLVAVSDACLGWLAQDVDELERFMTATGYGPGALRAALGSPALRHALIDYVAANEPVLLALCANGEMSTDRVMRVWHHLNPGH